MLIRTVNFVSRLGELCPGLHAGNEGMGQLQEGGATAADERKRVREATREARRLRREERVRGPEGKALKSAANAVNVVNAFKGRLPA